MKNIFQKITVILKKFPNISRRFFSAFIAFTLILPLFAPWQGLHTSASPSDEEYDLVAILVDETLYNTGSEQQTNSLTGKIYRYANDIQKALLSLLNSYKCLLPLF